jgi:radical SAM protein with 4Fe4S-binding SPASM domain
MEGRMTLGIHTPWKVAHHRNLLDKIRDGQPAPPLHVQLIPTNACPHNCRFCALHMSGYPSNETFNDRDKLTSEELTGIVYDCANMGVKAIELTGGGEPTVHRDFPELCSRIVQYGIKLGVVTNGTQPNDGIIDGLAAADWVRVSIDAGSSETYSAIRNVPSSFFTRARETIRTLASSRPRPVIGVGFVVTKDNWQEIIQACRHAKHDGADNIRIGAVFQNNGPAYFKSFQREAELLCLRAEESLGDQTFTVYNRFYERSIGQQSPDLPCCRYQLLKTYVAADGNVYRCCALANNHRGLLGSIRPTGFKKLWFSEETQSLLCDLDARQCPACAYNDTNRLIDYLTDKDPLHVDFL